jgi:hypothetical protein
MQEKPDSSKKAMGHRPSSGEGQTQGRPPLPREIARSERIVTFVTGQEKANLKRLADATSLSLSAICHRLIVQGIQREDRTKKKGKPMKERANR